MMVGVVVVVVAGSRFGECEGRLYMCVLVRTNAPIMC